MRLVKTCPVCGLVNDGREELCGDCGERLPRQAFSWRDLRPGMRLAPRYPTGSPIPKAEVSRPPGRQVVAPDGRVWVVRRCWLRREPRWRHLPALDNALQDAVWFDGVRPGLSAVLSALVYVVTLPLKAIFVVVESFDLAGGLVFDTVGRVLFRQPWTVEALSGRQRRTWEVTGWHRSRLAVDQIAWALEHGEEWAPR
jgi:hypothetical protein